MHGHVLYGAVLACSPIYVHTCLAPQESGIPDCLTLTACTSLGWHVTVLLNQILSHLSHPADYLLVRLTRHVTPVLKHEYTATEPWPA